MIPPGDVNWDVVEMAAKAALAPIGLPIRANQSRFIKLFAWATDGKGDDPLIFGITVQVRPTGYLITADACHESTGVRAIDDIPDVTVLDEPQMLHAIQELGSALAGRAKEIHL